MILKKLQDIKKELEKSIQSRSIVKSPAYGDLIEVIKESLELAKNDHNQKEEIMRDLRNISRELEVECAIVEEDCLDSLKHSLANSEPLSDKYNTEVAYKNSNIVVEALKLLHDGHANGRGALDAAVSLQKKMKEALEKMQQQNAARKEELEKKIEEKFGNCIESGTIDAVSIAKYGDQDLLYATIKLKEDNKSTDIKVSEFLNSEFCKENNIAGFSLLHGDQKESIRGHIHDGVRYYDLGCTTQYKIKFNWYIDERECSITLGANSDSSITILGDRPIDAHLETNKDVRIKVGDKYLSLAEAVKTCKQNSQQSNDASSKLSQPSANEHFRSVGKTIG